MQKAAEGIKPEDIVEIVLRRRWWIIATFCLSMIVGIYLAFTLPKIYKAETLILIQPQKVPANYVQSVVSADIDSRINTMSQQVLSRSNLEKIIEDFNLFSGPEYKRMFMEDKIEGLRKRISFDLIQRDRRRDADAFSISFEGRDPQKVMKITNALTSYIISENLRVRETQAVGTSDFLDEELNSIRQQLVVQEEKLKDYRAKFMGGLPEQLESNLRVLDRLQEQLSAKQASIRDAKNRLAMLENQISENPGLLSRDGRRSADGSVVDSGESLTPAQAKAQLAYLETRYTEKHPDVVRLKKIIADFEKEKGKNGGDSSGETRFVPANSTLQIEEVKAEIRTYAADISNLMAQIHVYQRRVEDTPKREQEYLSLRRDYENIKATYDSLLNRQLEAEISVNMEKKQKGEQFRILDPARLPEKPISPDMKKLFLLSLAAGLGIGGGLVFLLEYLNTSFRRPEDVESYLGLSVLATLPLICHEKDKRRQKFNQIFSILSIVLSLMLLAAFATLTFKGVDKPLALFNSFITT
jgi:polysaccharide chain length determinant protein (PEP-CTERM system associated)